MGTKKNNNVKELIEKLRKTALLKEILEIEWFYTYKIFNQNSCWIFRWNI